MARRPPYFSSYTGLDRYLLQHVPPTQWEVVFSFTEVAALLALPLSARTVEERVEIPRAQRHWQRLGFAVTVDWLARQVVFTRLADNAD